MANRYIWSAAAGTGSGVDWANAFTNIAAANAVAAAGDDYWVASDHNFAAGGVALVWAFPGTAALPNRVISVNRAGAVPPVAADITVGAAETNTGNFGITITGVAYIEGVRYTYGTGAVAPDARYGGTVQTDIYMKNCACQSAGTSASTTTMGSASANIGCNIVWDNTTYQIGAISAIMAPFNGAMFEWKGPNSSITGANIPTNLFSAGGSNIHSGIVTLDLDLSSMNAKTIVGALSKAGIFFINRSKLHSGTIISAAPTSPSVKIFVTHSSSGANAYREEKHDIHGDQTIETVIVRTGGARINGTSVAVKVVTSANVKQTFPFEMIPIIVPNQTTGANVTLTFEGIWGGGAVPNNDDVWLEVDYLGSAASPISSFASNGKATVLTANSPLTASTSTWGGSVTPFKLSVTMSAPQPGLAGELYAKIKFGAASTTFYIDPVGVIS